MLLTDYATALPTRAPLNLTSYTSKCGIGVRKLQHSLTSAHELLKIKQEDIFIV